MRTRIILAATSIAAVLAFIFAGAANAVTITNAPITAVTSVSNHPDTTSATGGTACHSSAGGPVWALDTYGSSFSATLTATAHTWHLVILDRG
jgi:hypothetical protein